MKKLTLTLCAVAAVASASFAGTQTYSGKEMKQVEQAPCPTWYTDNEWNVGISGIYAVGVGDDDGNNNLNNFQTSWDDGFGGAIDIKYFFRRYFGIGIQGFGISVDRDDSNFARVVDDENDFTGGLLGTFTFRYPIPCSRFAPYLWLGAGGVWGDGDDNTNILVGVRNNDSEDGGFIGQIGAGFEVRFSQHVGWTNDISYNLVTDTDADFLMFRTGLNFAF